MTLEELDDKINEVNQRFSIESLALGMILVEAGIVTVEQWNRYRTKATHRLDQYWTTLRDSGEIRSEI